MLIIQCINKRANAAITPTNATASIDISLSKMCLQPRKLQNYGQLIRTFTSTILLSKRNKITLTGIFSTQ
jgi:hypothetical protein